MTHAHILGPPRNGRRVLTEKEFMELHGEEIRNGTFGKEVAVTDITPTGGEAVNPGSVEKASLEDKIYLRQSRKLVSRSSECDHPLVGAVLYTNLFNAPLQTMDLAFRVRNELDIDPLWEPEPNPDDFSKKCQTTSTLCLFHRNPEGIVSMYVSDLQTMYPGDFNKQYGVAFRIQSGLDLPLNDPLSQQLISNSKTQIVPLGENTWPIEIRLSDISAHTLINEILPTTKQYYANYLARTGFDKARIYLLGDLIPVPLFDSKSCMILPMVLGESSTGSNIIAGDGDNPLGRARAYRGSDPSAIPTKQTP